MARLPLTVLYSCENSLSFLYLGFAVPDSEGKFDEYEMNNKTSNKSSNVKGFSMLMNLLEDHTDIAEIFYLLFALLLGFPIAGEYWSIGATRN